MTWTRRGGILAAALSLGSMLTVSPVSAFDAEQTFRPWGVVLSVDGGGGGQTNFIAERHEPINLAWIQGRASLLPFGTVARDTALYGALEIGLEPIYQRYFNRQEANWAGLGAAARYHFLSLGGFVPYVEVGAAPGYSDLKVLELRSEFAFRLYGGGGVSLFVDDRTALYLGYRIIHVSNGNTSHPNRGFEAHAGVLGISFFFP